MTSITHNNTPWFSLDSEGIDYLVARSDVSDLKRPVLYRLSASSPVQARQLSGHLLAFGFDVIDNPRGLGEAGEPIALTLRRHSATGSESIAETRRIIDHAIEKFGGRYESWSTYVVVGARRRLPFDSLVSGRPPTLSRLRRAAVKGSA